MKFTDVFNPTKWKDIFEVGDWGVPVMLSSIVSSVVTFFSGLLLMNSYINTVKTDTVESVSVKTEDILGKSNVEQVQFTRLRDDRVKLSPNEAIIAANLNLQVKQSRSPINVAQSELLEKAFQIEVRHKTDQNLNRNFGYILTASFAPWVLPMFIGLGMSRKR
jgi:hypothetical protein